MAWSAVKSDKHKERIEVTDEALLSLSDFLLIQKLYLFFYSSDTLLLNSSIIPKIPDNIVDSSTDAENIQCDAEYRSC